MSVGPPDHAVVNDEAASVRAVAELESLSHAFLIVTYPWWWRESGERYQRLLGETRSHWKGNFILTRGGVRVIVPEFRIESVTNDHVCPTATGFSHLPSLVAVAISIIALIIAIWAVTS